MAGNCDIYSHLNRERFLVLVAKLLEYFVKRFAGESQYSGEVTFNFRDGIMQHDKIFKRTTT